MINFYDEMPKDDDWFQIEITKHEGSELKSEYKFMTLDDDPWSEVKSELNELGAFEIVDVNGIYKNLENMFMYAMTWCRTLGLAVEFCQRCDDFDELDEFLEETDSYIADFDSFDDYLTALEAYKSGEFED